MQWHCSPWSFFEHKCNRQQIGVSKIKKKKKKSLLHVAMVASFLFSKNRGPANMALKN